MTRDKQPEGLEAPAIAGPDDPPSRAVPPDRLREAALVQLRRMLEADDPEKPKQPPPRRGWSYSSDLGVGNDNLPLVGLVPRSRRDPYAPDRYADDDGRTFNASLEHNLTNEERGLQISLLSQYEMLTQDGAMEDSSRNRRADLLNNIVQLNKRYDLGSGLVFFAGLGAGTQTVGNLGGLRLQDWFHHHGGFGGRFVGQGLQDDYGGLSGTRTSPAVSGGLGVRASTGSQGWKAGVGASVSGLAGLGSHGMSAAQAGLSLDAGHDRIAELHTGIFTSIGHANGAYLDFAPLEHASVGYEVKLQIDVLRKIGVPVAPYAMLQSNGGGFGDTSFTVGFVIGGTHASWLKPTR